VGGGRTNLELCGLRREGQRKRPVGVGPKLRGKEEKHEQITICKEREGSLKIQEKNVEIRYNSIVQVWGESVCKRERRTDSQKKTKGGKRK